MRRTRRALSVGMCVWAACLMSLASAGHALAASGHRFVASLAEAPAGMRLVAPGAVAVDRATGEVFVGDPGTGYVDIFSSSGAYEARVGDGFVEATGVAVDEANGDVYVADGSQDLVLVYEPVGVGGYRLLGRWTGQGTPGGSFGNVTGVAVDNSAGPSAGLVYVVEARAVGMEDGVVDVFRPQPNPAHLEEVGEGDGAEGEFVRRLGGPGLEAPNGVVVSPATGRVLVADSLAGAVYAYDAQGSYEAKVTGKGSPYGVFAKGALVGDVAGVGVDEVSGDVYVAEAERRAVSQYGPSGEWEGWITATPAGELVEPRGVALTPAGEAYVADAGAGVVDRFAGGVVVSSVETGKVAKSSLTRTTALLPGTINGEGMPSSYRFQYGATEALGSETPVQSAGTGLQSVSATVDGLDAGRVYYYRIVGEDEDGVSYGAVREFETRPAVEALETGPVTGLEPEGAVLTGSLKRGGLATHYYFQYGTTTAYGSEAPEPPEEVPAGESEKEEKAIKTVDAAVTGLSPNTLYHYRLVAGNEEYGTTYGQDRTFTTSGPPTISDEQVTGIGQEEATLNTKVDPDQIATSYRFEYGQTTSYGAEAPVGSATIGAGASPVPVAATLASLKAGATYHYRVVAENEAGRAYGQDRTFTTVAPAPVDATFVTEVSATGATLHTRINALGHDTRYYFQYGTQDCAQDPSGCTDTPVAPGGDIGEGSEDVEREVALSGLVPGTSYHYRVLASNGLGVSEGPERTFTTRVEDRTLALPDARAWELVTPPDKEGAPVEALTREGGLIVAAEGGDALTYLVDNALGSAVEGNRSPEWQQILATRGPSAWSSKDIATPSLRAEGAQPGAAPEYQFFTPDLATALVEPAGRGGGMAEPPLAPGVKQATPYLRDNASGTFLPLVTEANTAPGTNFGEAVHFVSATPDLSHVVINSSTPLTGRGSAAGLYEWSGGVLRFVSSLPNGAPSSPAELGYYHAVAHAISNDGSRIIWTKKEESNATGHLYLRDTVKNQTIQLDAAQGVAEPWKGSAQFQWASSDASRVFFSDKQRLTPDSTAEPNTEPPSADLYECEIAEENGRLVCHLRDLTVDHNQGQHAAVQYFVLGASEDGTSVYLIAQGVLAANRNGNDETAQPGEANLYELHYDGAQWSTTFIATLSREDSPEWEGFRVGNTAHLTARVSPNGRYLAFMSAAPITGYDNVDASPEAKGARDEEVFLYDSATASLGCVSCNLSGARPEGVLDVEEAGEGLGLLVDRVGAWLGHRLAGNIPGWTAQSIASALFQSRYLSDQGRLYFNSPDDLVPAAENHKEDVYQYEPSGVGSCQSGSGGCVSLISGGSSDRESAFIEATPDGSNVFFLTDARLLPRQDTDTAFDIYDARECSALSPCLSPPQAEEAPCAETRTCRPAEPAQPLPGVSPVVQIAGSGNIVSQPSPPAKHGIEGRKASRAPTRAQKLARALRRCRKRYAHSKRKRASCRHHAIKRYGRKYTARKKARTKHRSRASGSRRRG
jgi:phosphodiesterase/alkaline phosphatase D-like protein